MKLVYFSNYLNHHQVALADAFFALLGDEYCFVATCETNLQEMKGGEDYTTRVYCLTAGNDEFSHIKALTLAKEADVCVFGACSQEYATHRAKSNPTGLSFEMGERWLKKGWVNIFSPVLLKWLVNYWCYYRKANFYKLCMSAFASKDDERLGCYKGKHFKWGYFTTSNSFKRECELFVTEEIRILWCARFLGWKRSELVVRLAEKLKKRDVSFHLDMIGTGEELNDTKELAERLDISDSVTFRGNLSNVEVRKEMSKSDIVLFTSDKNEGWGVVANEAMSEGCLLIGSDEIGSVPYLVKDGENGLIFRSNNIDSLEEKIMQAIENKEHARKMAMAGKHTLEDVWSAKNAAESLLKLIDGLMGKGDCVIEEGPCSKA